MQTPVAVTDTQIITALPSGLAAGAQTVQIIQSLLLGMPPTPHQLGFQSDLATFVLHPEISKSGCDLPDHGGARFRLAARGRR